MGTRGGGKEEGKLEEGGQKVETYSYKVNKYQDVMSNRMTIADTMYGIQESFKRVNPMTSHYREKII